MAGRSAARGPLQYTISQIASFPISEDHPNTSVTRVKSILYSISSRDSILALTSSSAGRPKRLLHALSDTSRLPPFTHPVSSVMVPSCASLATWECPSRGERVPTMRGFSRKVLPTLSHLLQGVFKVLLNIVSPQLDCIRLSRSTCLKYLTVQYNEISLPNAAHKHISFASASETGVSA